MFLGPLALTGVLMLGAMAGCGSSESRATGPAKGVQKDSYTIAVIPKGLTHEFWKSVHFGAQKAADELGNVKIIWQGPAEENDTTEQVNTVENMISRGVDAICLAPNDSDGLVGVVRKANNSNIPVVIFDSGLNAPEIIVSYVATSNYKAGELAADRLAEVLQGKGGVILLRYKQGSESTEQREQGFLDRLAKLNEDPAGEVEISVITHQTWPNGTSAAAAADKAETLLDTHQDQVDGWFAVCEPLTTGTLEALKRTSLTGKVKVVGFDPTPDIVRALSEKKLEGIVLQDPVQMGYLAVKTAVEHLNGKKVLAQLETGEYIATPENMTTDKYAKLLQPPQKEG